jgi:hypothetical protein
MAKLKNQKCILTDLILPEGGAKAGLADYSKRATRILWLEDFLMKGAPNIILSWYWKAMDEEGTPSHVHDFDEVIGFIGNDPKNPSDLGAEVELWLEDEKYMLTKTCLVYIPKGLRHCPLRMVKVDRPILFLALSLTEKYTKDAVLRGAEFGKHLKNK